MASALDSRFLRTVLKYRCVAVVVRWFCAFSAPAARAHQTMSDLVIRISLANWLSCRLGLYRKIPGKTLRVAEQLREEFQPIRNFGGFNLPAKALHAVQTGDAGSA